MTSRIVVIVDSRYGSTLTLAKVIAEGALGEGPEVCLCRVALSEPEFSVDSSRVDFIAAQTEFWALPQAMPEDLE
jgi:NAD(P)H dehydrogenase (quinone)